MREVPAAGRRDPVPIGERSFATFVSALRHRPGIKLTLVSLVGFGSIVVIRHGLLSLVVTLAISLPVGILLGYWSFRRTGRV